MKGGFGGQTLSRCDWIQEDLVVLHCLEIDLTRAVDLWVHPTLERCVVEFEVENHRSFSKVEVVF